ncbi:hypothetical protein V6N13_011098 [Hibiscus sabdariffa]
MLGYGSLCQRHGFQLYNFRRRLIYDGFMIPALSVFFSFVPRSGNKVVHILAKDASLDSDDSFWVEEVLVVARAAVAEDWRSVDPS